MLSQDPDQVPVKLTVGAAAVFDPPLLPPHPNNIKNKQRIDIVMILFECSMIASL